MDVSFVVAVAENGIIGNNNELPWRLPSDLKRFRKLTMGKPIVMGRKTFLSIGKPLDGRANIILSRDKSFSAEGAFVVDSVEAALELGQEKAELSGADEIMIIGGAEIYAAFMPHVTRLYYTLVHAEPLGDASFPLNDFSNWKEISRELVKAGPKDSADFSNILYEKLS
ncbi:MAG: dihydrofolate reductase [Rhizobiales bacterium]|nr:dihydrofolate reductase [Hyphomicrobiales bacterium]